MPQPPNIVVITTHDTGQFLGCYGVETVQSPNLDAMAAGGAMFANYFCASPVCSPSRGAAMTGRWPQSNGLMGLTHNPWLWELNPDERHLAAILGSAGYRPVLFNIQHEDKSRERLGFAETVPCRAPDGGRTTCIDTACGFRKWLLGRPPEDGPFYAQIGFFETHTPHDFGGVPPDRSKGVTVPPRLVRDEASEAHMALLQGAVRRADEAVGMILDALSEADLTDNTLIVYTSDHGYEAARDKWFCFDPGLRIPLILRWPAGGIAGGTTIEAMQSNTDLAPTILELAGLPVPDNMQGQSFAGAFRDPAGYTGRELIYSMFQGKELRSVRTDTHKLIVHFAPYRELVVPVDIKKKTTLFHSSPVVQMYDLVDDPDEFVNIADEPEHAETRRHLLTALFSWMEDVGDPLLQHPPWTPFYQKAMTLYRSTERPSP